MPKQRLNLVAGKRSADKIGMDVWKHTVSGTDVLIDFGSDPQPERMLKVIRFAIGEAEDIEIVLRDARVRDYIDNGLKGAVLGAGAASAGLLVAAAKGVALTYPAVFAALGIGALLGASIGAASATVSRVTVYRQAGTTRVLFSAA